MWLPISALAHGGEIEVVDTASESQSEEWDHMQDMHAVLHQANFETTDISDGIITSITSTDAELVEAITSELIQHEDDIQEHFSDMTVLVEQIATGAEFTFTSTDSDVVKNVQSEGNFLLGGYLMEEMMELMHESEGMMGGTMMHDYGAVLDDSMMGYSTNMMGWSGLGSLLNWLFGIGIVVVLIIVIMQVSRKSGGDTAQDVLKKRYANGEIDKKEFEEKSKELQ